MMSVIVGAVGGFLSKAAESVGKYLPMIGAYFAGKKAAKAEVIENTLEAKNEAEEVGQEIKDELREKPTGDYIRDNDI